MTNGEWRTWRTGRALGAALLLGLAAAACSGDGDSPGAGGGPASPTAAVTGHPLATVTATAVEARPPETPSPTATWPSTATPTATPTAVPTAKPPPSPTPIQPENHANGTFTIVVSQGAVRIGVRVEVAATLAQRQQGLMFRTQLAEGEGMLFLFDRDVQTGFWMRNTLVALDIAYIGADLRVNEVRQGKPLDETPLVPAERYRYVLEVNDGWFERNGLGPGSLIELPDGLPAPTAD